jgi:hypothetical protein
VIIATCFFSGCKKQSSQPIEAELGGQVHGFVEADMTGDGKTTIQLPGAEVYLKNSQSGKEGPHVTTDAWGRFVIPDHPLGNYVLCAVAQGYNGKCEQESFALGKETYYPRIPLKIFPIGRFLSGRVVLSDGVPCFHESSVFHSHLQAKVALIDASGTTVRQVLANWAGSYAIPDVPANQSYQLNISCAEATLKTPAAPASWESLSSLLRSPSILQNRSPKVAALSATLNGRDAANASPGSTVKVTAKTADPDHDQIHYRWTDGTNSFSSVDGQQIDWKLPSASATNALFLEITDGKGGYATSKVVVVTGGTPAIKGKTIDFHSRLFTARGIVGNKFILASIPPTGTSALPSHGAKWLSLKNTACDSTPAGCKDETAAYYQAIGATNGKETLDKFKAANGFIQGDTSAIYYNAHDLGLGREMHCRRSDNTDNPDVACYVTNYGLPGGDPETALAEAIGHSPVTATVGMDYSAPPGSTTKAVKFYVWDANGNLSPQAILDSEGPKSVPQICLVCHGGTYSEATHTVRNASFREFDIFSFLYSTQSGFTQTDQIDKFMALNQIIKASKPNPNNPNKPITALIDGIFPAGKPPVEDWAPDGWKQAGKAEFYTRIPRVYCRACHIAQTAGIDWTKFTQFQDYSSTIEDLVCSSRTMPHAEVPFRLFWTSPADRDYLASPQTGLGFSGPCPTVP